MTLALAALAAAGLGGLAWRRLGRGRLGAPPALRLVARAGLTQKAGLALVEVDGHRLLVGYGDGAPTLLSTLDAEAPATGAGATGKAP